MRPQEVTGTLVWLLTFLFLTSAGGKVWMWRAGRLERLIAITPGPQELRRPILAVAVCAELFLAASLPLQHGIALPASSLLMLVYTAYSIRLPSGSPCNCFGAAFEFAGRLES